MNKLNLKNINLHAPYEVRERDDVKHEFYFWSEYGIEYDISFVPNHSIIPSGAYEIGINNRGHHTSPGDPKFLTTTHLLPRRRRRWGRSSHFIVNLITYIVFSFVSHQFFHYVPSFLSYISIPPYTLQ